MPRMFYDPELDLGTEGKVRNTPEKMWKKWKKGRIKFKGVGEEARKVKPPKPEGEKGEKKK